MLSRMGDRDPADLLETIRQKRRHVEAFLATAVPRKRRLLNITIVAGALAAALTAAPAAGGQPFTTWMTAAMGLTSPSWRLLCGVASVCSILATVTTQLLKSNNLEERITRAQGCRAKLEVLEIGLAAGQIEPQRATAEYLQCVQESAFIEA
jgi:MFS family permease